MPMASAASLAVLRGLLSASLMRTNTSGSDVSLGSASIRDIGPGAGSSGSGGSSLSGTGGGMSRAAGPFRASIRAAWGKTSLKTVASGSASGSAWAKRGRTIRAASSRPDGSGSGSRAGSGRAAPSGPSSWAMTASVMCQKGNSSICRAVRTVPAGSRSAPSPRERASARTIPGWRAFRGSRLFMGVRQPVAAGSVFLARGNIPGAALSRKSSRP